MKDILVVIPTIRYSDNFVEYAQNFKENGHIPDILILDETATNRAKIREAFNEFRIEFFGEAERNAWFNSRKLKQYKNVIPRKAHNELSFAYLLALERDRYKMIVQFDDDTRPYLDSIDMLGEHEKQLNLNSSVINKKGTSWINTHPEFYVRGFPYCQRKDEGIYRTVSDYTKNVLNMGLWTKNPDLNAIDYLAFNNPIRFIRLSESFTVAKKQFAPICSMNISFRPKIIPAYYQLYSKDRYDDILSGQFLKVIADHLDYGIKIGTPYVIHDKSERCFFDDAEKEWKAMRLNEHLWKELLKIELTESTWLNCYRELAQKIRKQAKHLYPHYIQNMTEKMLLWCSLCEKVKTL